jgi:hypothetical protein
MWRYISFKIKEVKDMESMYPFNSGDIKPHFDKYVNALFQFDLEGCEFKKLLEEIMKLKNNKDD